MEIFLTDFGMMALVGGFLSSLITSLPGTIVVLRKMSFFGSGIAHLSFLGVGIALSLDLPVTPVVMVVSIASALILGYLSRRGIHEDVGIGIMFSVSMALGMILIQVSRVDTSRVMAYLFGDILAITPSDISILSIVAVIVMVYTLFFRDHLIYMIFDEDFSKVLGLKAEIHYYTFLMLLAVSIVLSIKMMGIILVSAMIVIPPSCAMLLSRTYKGMFRLSPIISMLSVLFGLSLSYTFDFPSGAAIVAIQGMFFAAAFSLKTLGK